MTARACGIPLVLLMSASTAAVAADSAPIDGGVIRQIVVPEQREIKKEAPGFKESGTLNVVPPKSEVPGAAGAILRLSGIQSDLPNDILGYEIVSPLIGQPISAQTWNLVRDRLWLAYRDQGHLTRADLELQGDGAAKIIVSRLTVRRVEVRAEASVEESRRLEVERLISARVRVGEPVWLPDLENLVRRFQYRDQEVLKLDIVSDEKDDDSVVVSFNVVPGRAASRDRVWTTSLDNTGTGKLRNSDDWRAMASFMNSVFGGDTLAAVVARTRSTSVVDVSYDIAMPALLPGRIFLGANAVEYEFETLAGVDQHGRSAAFRLGGRLADFVWGAGQISHGLTLESSSQVDYIAGLDTRKRMRTATYEVSALGFMDNELNAQARVIAGHLDISGLYAADIDRLTVRTAGDFLKLAADAQWRRPLTRTTLLDVSMRAQLATRNLDSSQQLLLGGHAGVRAYGPSEARGDDGLIVSANVWQAIPAIERLQIGAFADAGVVRPLHSPYDKYDGPKERKLAGAGLAASWSVSDFSLVVRTARPVSRKQDSHWRAWVQASMAF